MGAWLSIVWFLIVLFFVSLGGGWPLFILGFFIWFVVASIGALLKV